ncbi:hypothetical protein [Robertkochia flava]|uniref:hypothetical protein n=1 Tax=Robertkochia flava TaxID=3447986 RepID=UPI001CCBC05A|nr:hypothetical protein [Robertkochia marina]
MKTRILASFMALSAVLWTSCSDEADNLTENLEIPVADIEINAQAELLSDQIDDIAASVVVDESAAAKSVISQRVELPACVTITKTANGDKVKKIIDFGNGCTLANGVAYSGQIIVEYIWNNELRQANIVVGTDNLGVNDLMITGRKEILRTWPAADQGGYPNSEVQSDLVVAHPSGLNARVTGTTTREWIAGFGTGNWADNVVLIGGNRRVQTYMNDSLLNTYEMEITDNLRREWACRFIVSGTLSLSNSLFSATLNYGDGNCDNKALLTTSSGRTKEIELR